MHEEFGTMDPVDKYNHMRMNNLAQSNSGLLAEIEEEDCGC